MKLVEIDENISSCIPKNERIDDEKYLKPCVLSALDSVMSEILNAPISDVEKWGLYSQTLQKYLNRIKFSSKEINSNVSNSHSVNNDETIVNPFNLSLSSMDSLRHASPLEMSGVVPIRDSLDSISQPIVRNSFESARNIDPSALTHQPLTIPEQIQPPINPDRPSNNRKTKKAKNPSTRRILPYRFVEPGRKKRVADTSLSMQMSQIIPCKVLLHRMNWEPTNSH